MSSGFGSGVATTGTLESEAIWEIASEFGSGVATTGTGASVSFCGGSTPTETGKGGAPGAGGGEGGLTGLAPMR